MPFIVFLIASLSVRSYCWPEQKASRVQAESTLEINARAVSNKVMVEQETLVIRSQLSPGVASQLPLPSRDTDPLHHALPLSIGSSSRSSLELYSEEDLCTVRNNIMGFYWRCCLKHVLKYSQYRFEVFSWQVECSPGSLY